MGNLTRDPELRYTPGGVAIANFGMAINEKWNNADGQVQEKVHFVDCSMFGKRAETVNEYFKKGSPIFVEGSLDYQTWETDGQKRNALKVKVFNFEFIGGKQEAKPGGSSNPSFPEGPGDVPEEDIPF